MRVVELSTDRLPSPPIKGGAIERYVFQISQELSKLGMEVHLISIGDDYRMERDSGIYRHVYPTKGANFLESIAGKALASITTELNKKLVYVNRALLQILRSIQECYGRVHVIHNHYFTTSFAPIMFKKLTCGEALLINHNHNVPKDNLVNVMLAKQYDLHLAVSRFVKNEMVRRLRIHPCKAHVVYNAIDVSKFICNESVRDRIRETYGIKKDEVVLLYVGRLTPEKGLHHLIDAYRIIRKELPNQKVTLFIAGPIGHFDLTEVGDVAYFRYLQRLFHEYELHGGVKYVGYVTDIASVYAMSDLVVIPSIWHDPCPSTVLEALASCKPVVAYPVGGIPELLEGLEYDFLADRIEPKDLAERAIHVLKSHDKIDFKQLREYVEKRFSTRVVARALKSLIEESLSDERYSIHHSS